MRHARIGSVLFALSVVACGAEPQVAPPVSGPPIASAPPPVASAVPETSAASELLSADTKQETPGGATFTAPSGWTVKKGTDRIQLDGPDPDIHLAVVDAKGNNADEVVQKAWLAAHPDFKRPPLPEGEGGGG